MRLLVLTNLYHPDCCGGATVFTDLCEGLADAGLEVTVRTAYPYYPEWTDKSGRNGWRIQRERINGVDIERYGLFIPSRPGSLLQRLRYDATFMASLARSLFRGRFDAVLVFCPLAGTVGAAALHRFLRRTPVWLSVQDLPAAAAAAAGISRSSSFSQRVLEGVQAWLFNRCDVWSTIAPVMLDQLEPMRRRRQPLVLLPNYLNQSLATGLAALPSKIGRPVGDPVRLLYSGNVGEKQGLLAVCESLASSDMRFTLKVHAAGSGVEPLAAWMRQRADPRFSHGPLLPEPDFLRALHDCDVFLITEKPNCGAAFIPSKLIPGMASQTPILGVCDPTSPLAREVADARVGACFSWDELSVVPEFLAGLPERQDEVTGWQASGLRRSRQFTREHVVGAFVRGLRAMVEHRRNPTKVMRAVAQPPDQTGCDQAAAVTSNDPAPA